MDQVNIVKNRFLFKKKAKASVIQNCNQVKSNTF